MAAPTLVRRELLNVAFLAFIPEGETVDSVTVAEATWPDSAPTTNWTAYEIPDVETLEPVLEYSSEVFQIPKASGGYFKDEEQSLDKVTLKGECAVTSSYFKQLEKALATAPVTGTAQAPYVNNTNYLQGVALIEYQNKSGVVTEREQIWCRLRLDNPGIIGPQTRKTKFSLEKRDSSANTYNRVA